MFLLFTLACCLIFFGTIFASHRIETVFRFRADLLAKIHDRCGEDIEASRDWEWRYKAFESVSYNDMVTHFWKPLQPNVWWGDTKFLHSYEKQK